MTFLIIGGGSGVCIPNLNLYFHPPSVQRRSNMTKAHSPHVYIARKPGSTRSRSKYLAAGRTVPAPKPLQRCMRPSDKAELFYTCWDARFLANRDTKTTERTRAPQPAATQSTAPHRRTCATTGPLQHVPAAKGYPSQAATNENDWPHYGAASKSNLNALPPAYGYQRQLVQAPYVSWPDIPGGQNTIPSVEWPAGNLLGHAAAPSYPDYWQMPGTILRHNQAKLYDNTRVAHSVRLRDGCKSAWLGGSSVQTHDAYASVAAQTWTRHSAASCSQGNPGYMNEHLSPTPGDFMQAGASGYPQQEYLSADTYNPHWSDQSVGSTAYGPLNDMYQMWTAVNTPTTGEAGWGAHVTQQPSPPVVANVDGLGPVEWSAEQIGGHHLAGGTVWGAEASTVGDLASSNVLHTVVDNGLADAGAEPASGYYYY
ncbi:hypothetical protein C2E23DRAFT_886057 [Lenzites betulinus]|nr:hypothetical protein C2E23DRAFT_886057 [Lenzites betulinus]